MIGRRHHDTTSGASTDSIGRREGRGRKYRWLRWVVLAVAAAVLGVELALVWDKLPPAFGRLFSARWWWLLAAVGAVLLSMDSFAQVQRVLLRSAGIQVKQWRSEAAFYAANSLSTTVPGGPVLAATFLFRQQRVWGASPVIASWQLVMAGVLQGVGLTLLGLCGAFLIGTKAHPLSLVFLLGALVAFVVFAQALASRPKLIDSIGMRMLSWVKRLRGGLSNNAIHKWRETLEQLKAVSLSRRQLAAAFGWSLFNWVADIAGLVFAAWASGGRPSLAGAMAAYAAARAVGSVPLVPGGLVTVEAVLVPALVTSGMRLPEAISATMIYRLISWLFVAAIGWVSFFFMFRTSSELDSETAERGGIDAEPKSRRDNEISQTRLRGSRGSRRR